ncbi:DUF5915 domain-containing protein [Dehalococcoidia bacterium]|nr:DUF5915 domain-containing protein [Dehalococcoidia bacterium]
MATDLTPDLVLEGKAREVVHRIQNMRKAAGFDIADRIDLFYGGGGDVEAVFSEYGDYVQEEVLAEHLSAEPAPSTAYAETFDLEGAEIHIAVLRAAG